MRDSLVVVDDVPGEFADRVVEAFHRRGQDVFTLTLSGGDTAASCYRRLASDAAGQIDWWQVDLYWTDERCVPLDHPDSNYTMARTELLDRVGAANATYPMRCDEGADAHQIRIGDLGQFDVVHLSLAPDGHVAALFGGSTGVDADDGRLVVMNDDPTGEHIHDRMTLTFAGIARARLVLVTACGEERADALARVVAGEDLPAGRVRGDKVVWIADPAAASQL